jgi:nitrile hydratase beta subunit
MNGVHDMGGMHGFGPVPVEDDAPFHADWERLVFGLVRVTRSEGVYDVDRSRYGIERMDPAAYLDATYFERWLASLERNATEAGVLSEAEIEAASGRALALDDPAEMVPESESEDPAIAARMRETFEQPASFDRPGADPQFDVGERVRVRNDHPVGHTRCPRYVRQATGEVDASHGNYVFPDANAHGEERAEPLYTVAFAAAKLWGPDAETPEDTVHIDLWEPYLEPATEDEA